MKYPQLVSTRAVNAISDWLVSRLEQLGVEAPQIYSRLLLSLLQSSVQINDPIEFSNLETFFANRKGIYRRYPPCEPNTLKKINAVQCLSEIVSSEQEIAAIETLVDELFQKIIDIENQSTDIGDDASLVTSFFPNDLESSQTHHFNRHHKELARSTVLVSECFVGGNNSRSRTVCLSKQTLVGDNELDPKKRYYRAFPALNKDMEESFWVSRKNAKLFTWPIDKVKTAASSSVSSSDSGLGSRKSGNNCVKVNERKQTVYDDLATENLQSTKKQEGMQSNNNNNNSNHNKNNTNNNGNIIATVVKRRTRRRRNQALSKSKNLRKNSCGSGNVCFGSNNKSYRSASPYWDTDFEGSWEMGRDLIKEFIVKQNRNRSTSESAAYANVNQRDRGQKYLEDNVMVQDKQVVEKVTDVANQDCSPILPSVDISFCCNDDDDDTLASVPEISDASLHSARRLYKRDVSGCSNEFLPKVVSDEQQDFVQFKAKFDSSLEALWKNSSYTANQGNESIRSGAGIHLMHAPNMQTSSTFAPFKTNLENFWSNYYNHRFDLSKISRESVTNEGNSTSLCCNNASNNYVPGDFFSMPCNIEDITKSPHKNRETPVNLFLQNSIWSEGSNLAVATDSGEKYLKQVWNSNKNPLTANDLNAKINATSSFTQENTFQIPSHYGNSKWSEGINAGPNPNSNNLSVHPAQVFMNVQNVDSNSTVSKSTDKNRPLCDKESGTSLKMDQYIVDLTDSTPTSASTTSCSSYSHSAANFNWQTPLLGQSLQPDMQSWSASNPMSLTEMYGSGSNSGNECKRYLGKYINTVSVSEEVSLPNHSASSSGFIEYARIKLADVKVLRQDNSKSSATGYPHKGQQQYISRPKERYTADEDLLNSDLTHFRPIKPYEDGHSFYICSALDVIEYERSQSGYLYWESEKYLEYTRKDSFLAEDETNGNTSQGAPLYGISNCAANARKESEERPCHFVMKFRLRNCDAVCQTDTECSSEIKEETEVEPHPLCLIFSNSLQGMPLQTTGLDCNNAIEALNKAVAAAAKAAAASRNSVDDSHWLSSASHYLPLEEVPSSAKDDISSKSCDEFSMQTYKSTFNALEQWSMRAIGKKCELSNENNTDPHTLWGMCAACNNEFKSVPANRMLKDELQLEADEIMSDLKYMQDLYIGEGAVGDSDSEWDVGETEAEGEAEAEAETESDNIVYRGKKISNDRKCNFAPNESDGDFVMQGINLTQPKQKQQDVFNKVNQLITDFLSRENVEGMSDTPASTQVQLFEGLWSFNNKNNIWQQANIGFKPIDLLKRLNDGQQNAGNFRTEDDPFLAQLSWDHDNLAEIWEKGTPVQAQATVVSALQHSDELKNYEMENSEIIKRNLKNMLDISISPAEMCSYAGTELPVQSAYKRVQEFLCANVSTSPKFKTTNRKRRHSASQNFVITTNNNNSNFKNSNFNQFDLKSNKSCNDKEMENMLTSFNDKNDFEEDLYSNSEETANNKQPKQTIITCKYWTTIDPDVSTNITSTLKGTAFSCLINKNASILKHVTMVTRPLTR